MLSAMEHVEASGRLKATRVLAKELLGCWADGCYLDALAHKFLELCLQLVKRYCEYVAFALKPFVAADNTPSNGSNGSSALQTGAVQSVGGNNSAGDGNNNAGNDAGNGNRDAVAGRQDGMLAMLAVLHDTEVLLNVLGGDFSESHVLKRIAALLQPARAEGAAAEGVAAEVPPPPTFVRDAFAAASFSPLNELRSTCVEGLARGLTRRCVDEVRLGESLRAITR